MPTTTTYLSLALYNATTDAGETFSAYRAAQSGISGSNMILIDTAIGGIQTALVELQALRGINSVDFVEDTANHYVGTNASIDTYQVDMVIALTLDGNSGGASVVNINSLGDVTLKKIDSGAKADIAANDLLEAQIYLFIYDGTDFVWVGKPTVSVSGTEDNFVSLTADGTLQDSGYAADDFLSAVSADEDNLASFDAAGLVQDSGYAADDFAPAANGVTNGDSHDHAGGDGAQIDHGGCGGLGDDDHTQYTKKSTLAAKGSMYVASAASTPAELGVGSNGEKPVSNSGATNGVNWMDDDYNITVILGDGVNTITTGVKGSVPVPVTGEIESVELVSHTSGSVVVDIWLDSFANFPPTDADSITASAPPTLASATTSQDATLTGWTKTLTKGYYLTFNVDSASTVTQVILTLYIRKTAVA